MRCKTTEGGAEWDGGMHRSGRWIVIGIAEGDYRGKRGTELYCFAYSNCELCESRVWRQKQRGDNAMD